MVFPVPSRGPVLAQVRRPGRSPRPRATRGAGLVEVLGVVPRARDLRVDRFPGTSRWGRPGARRRRPGGAIVEVIRASFPARIHVESLDPGPARRRRPGRVPPRNRGVDAGKCWYPDVVEGLNRGQLGSLDQGPGLDVEGEASRRGSPRPGRTAGGGSVSRAGLDPGPRSGGLSSHGQP